MARVLPVRDDEVEAADGAVRAAPDAARDGLVMAVHELANAMTVVLGLATDGRDPSSILAEIAAVARAGLRVSRALEGRDEVEEDAPGDGLGAVGRVVEGLRLLASQHGVHLVFERSARAAEVADTHALAAIAWNLVKNALEASSPGDVVRVEARAYGRFLALQVVDGGHGMSAVLRARTRAAGGRGRGVGLKIARALAERLGAELRHEPGSPCGTVATVLVPLRRGLREIHTTPNAGLARGCGSRSRSQPARVLLVEDDALLRGLVVARLSQAGHVVVEAADGRAALEPTGPFDVALLDAHLGTESADDDLVARLRTRAQRIVAVTGDPSTRLNVDHVLRKPFDVEELLELVDALVASATPG